MSKEKASCLGGGCKGLEKTDRAREREGERGRERERPQNVDIIC